MTIEEVKKKFKEKGYEKSTSYPATDKLYFTKGGWQYKADIPNNKLTVLTSAGMVEDVVDLQGFLEKM